MWTRDQAVRLGKVVTRLDRDLTQEKLAYAAGLTKNQVQLIEAGRASGRKGEAGAANPRLSTLAGLAKALGISVADLLTEARI